MELSVEPSENSLADMTKSELLDFAEANGIYGVDSSMKKAEIYEIITASIS